MLPAQLCESESICVIARTLMQSAAPPPPPLSPPVVRDEGSPETSDETRLLNFPQVMIHRLPGTKGRQKKVSSRYNCQPRN